MNLLRGAARDASNDRTREGQLSEAVGGCSLAALRSLQLLHRRIAALPKRELDPLQDDIMDFAALFEGDLAQRLIDGLRQVKARMDDIRPGPPPSGPLGCF